MPSNVGLGYIEKLLRQPGKPIPYADLVAVGAPEHATEAAEQTANENLEDDSRRFYSRVVMALKRAYEKLEEHGVRKLAAHFRKEISTTDGVCKYTADPSPAWSFDPL